MRKLVVLGAGGHGEVVADCAINLGYKDIEFLDDNRTISSVIGFPVVGEISDIDKYNKADTDFFVAIGNNCVRVELLHKLMDKGCNVVTLIHPKAVVSSFAEIGKGTLVMPGAIINAVAKIGIGVIINTGVCVDHNCTIEEGVHISPGAVLSGTVRVGRGAWICAGAVVSNNINIGAGSQVAAGAAVVKDVDDFVIVAGVPAEIKKKI